MSKNKQFVELLQEKKALKAKDIKGYSLNFVNALAKAGYIEVVKDLHLQGQPIVLIKLLKDIGEVFFSRGILKDYKEKQIYKINKDADTIKYNNKVLTAILKAMLEINKEEILKAEIIKKAQEFKDFTRTASARWFKKLENIKAIAKTNNYYRNSEYYLINLLAIKKILEDLEKIKNSKMIF